MSVALQIRDVPEGVRDTIADRAARRGQSMQSYLLEILQREARVQVNTELFDRTAPHRVVIPPESDPTKVIREGRDQGFELDRDDIVRGESAP